MKKIKFVRQDKNKKRRLKTGWRKPKGYQSKLGKRKRGKGAVVSVGYSKGKNKKDIIIIRSLDDLNKIKNIEGKENKIILVGKVGLKKKIMLFNEAEKIGISFDNLNKKKIDEIKKRYEEAKKKKKEKLMSRVKKKKKKKEKKKEELAEKVEKVEKKEVDEKKEKEIEKKEKDKLLITRKY